jgi:hypothetical protein
MQHVIVTNWNSDYINSTAIRNISMALVRTSEMRATLAPLPVNYRRIRKAWFFSRLIHLLLSLRDLFLGSKTWSYKSHEYYRWGKLFAEPLALWGFSYPRPCRGFSSSLVPGVTIHNISVLQDEVLLAHLSTPPSSRITPSLLSAFYSAYICFWRHFDLKTSLKLFQYRSRQS